MRVEALIWVVSKVAQPVATEVAVHEFGHEHSWKTPLPLVLFSSAPSRNSAGNSGSVCGTRFPIRILLRIGRIIELQSGVLGDTGN